MPVRHLPPNPNLDHLKHQAKDLIRDHAARAPHSAQLLREFHPRFLHSTDAEIFAAKLALNDVQLAIARQSGFPSWARLKRHIEKPTLTDRLDLPHHERIEDPVFRRAVDLIDQGDESGLRAHLRQHPRLAHQHVNFEGGNYFRNPTLLEFAAENPIRKVDLVGVGLNATDTLIHVPVFPQRGSKTEYSTRALQPGGQAASTVVACATWGLSTRYVGKLGEDDAGRLHRDAFHHAGVDAQIVTVPGASVCNLILVDAEGERTVLCRRDERMAPPTLRPQARMDRPLPAPSTSTAETAACTLACQWAREAGIPVVADLDESYPGVETLLENVDYLIVSRDFPTQHMREPNLERALRSMFTRYGARLAAATLGRTTAYSLGRPPNPPHPRLLRPGRRHHRRRRHLPRRLHLRPAPGLAPRAAARLRLCRCRCINCTASGARGGIPQLKASLRHACPRRHSAPTTISLLPESMPPSPIPLSADGRFHGQHRRRVEPPAGPAGAPLSAPPHQPRSSLRSFPPWKSKMRMGFPRDYLEFTTWYLLKKGYITRADNSAFTLTAEGVDFVEIAARASVPVLNKLLTSTAGYAFTSCR
jgi:sulfofructose kinase